MFLEAVAALPQATREAVDFAIAGGTVPEERARSKSRRLPSGSGSAISARLRMSEDCY